MNIHSTTHNYFRTAAPADIGRTLGSNHKLDLSGVLQLSAAVGKVMLFMLPVVLGINLLISHSLDGYRREIKSRQEIILQAEGANIQLRAEKARLIAPEYMKTVAAEKLSLMVPGPEQIQRM